jgi:hypothetical protein
MAISTASSRPAPMQRIVIAGLLLLCCMVAVSAAHAMNTPIYKCIDVLGNVLFSDAGCPNAARYTPPTGAITKFTPLSAAQAAQLKQLSQSNTQIRIQRQKQARKRQQAMAQQTLLSAKACTRAKANLVNLAAQRRKGYSIKQAAKLDAAEAAYRAAKKQHC